MGAAKAAKKVFIISISFVLAVVLLLIANVVAAHLFLAKLILFPPEPIIVPPPEPQPKKATKEVKNKKEKVKTPPKIVKKTVYVPPTREDLERIQRELETSEPLPPPSSSSSADEDGRRSASLVESVVSSSEAFLKKRAEIVLRRRNEESARERKVAEEAAREADELAEAHASFAERIESYNDDDEAGAISRHYAEQLSFVREVLGRTSFKDLDRKTFEETMAIAMDDLRWLLGADGADELLRNGDGILLKALVGDSETTTGNATCHPSFLSLDEGEHSAEFVPPPPVAKKRKKKRKKASAGPVPPIPPDAARESDLLAIVEEVKDALSRWDLSPVDAAGFEALRSVITPAAIALRTKRERVLREEANLRDFWVEKTRTLVKGLQDQEEGANDDAGGGGAGGTCASSDLVTSMVEEGLEALRRKDPLRPALVSALFRHFAHDPETVRALSDALGDSRAKEPFLEASGDAAPQSPPGASSWTVGRRSVAHAIDGPFLHDDVAGWIDYVADAVAGYNDHVDAAMDWVVGEEGGVSVGSTAAEAVSRMARKIPLPDDAHVRKMRKAGVLAGRTRVLLED